MKLIEAFRRSQIASAKIIARENTMAQHKYENDLTPEQQKAGDAARALDTEEAIDEAIELGLAKIGNERAVELLRLYRDQTKQQESEIGRLNTEITRLQRENARLRHEAAIAVHTQWQEKRLIAKAHVSKEVIRQIRGDVRNAIVSIRDLAGRRPNEVTAEHLTDLAAQIDVLIAHTNLPRR